MFPKTDFTVAIQCNDFPTIMNLYKEYPHEVTELLLKEVGEQDVVIAYLKLLLKAKNFRICRECTVNSMESTIDKCTWCEDVMCADCGMDHCNVCDENYCRDCKAQHDNFCRF